MNKAFKQWSRSCLPADFFKICGEVGRLQAFLETILPDEIKADVHVINANDESIVVAASNAQIANYLRLYQIELQQQIRETFNTSQSLKIKTFPDQALKVSTEVIVNKPRNLGPSAVENLQAGAEWIEHEDLRDSLKSLAESIRKSSSRD